MNKDELMELVDHVNSCWNKTPFMDELTKQRRAWWHLLGDLELTACKATVDNMAISDDFQPRPGEVRRRTICGRPMTAIEAWSELQNAREAVYAGRLATPLSPLTQDTVKRLGDQAKGMHTNGDRDKFTEIYNTVVAEWVETLCALPE